MKGSKLPYLDRINTIVLAAGHGEGDPGAVNGNRKESDENIFITERIAELLRAKGLDVVVVPHSLGLANSIAWLNQRYTDLYSAWAIEIHRDMNAPNLPEARRNDQMGVYYWGDPNGDNNNSDDDVDSRAIADFMVDRFLRYGAFKGTDNTRDFDGSWSKDHYIEWSRFHLGWMQQTKCLTHLIEHGYMSGRGDEEHLRKLAKWSAYAIYEAFTGQEYEQPQPEATPAPAPVATPPTMTLQESLKAAIQSHDAFDDETKNMLSVAIDKNDADYIIKYSGAVIRKDYNNYRNLTEIELADKDQKIQNQQLIREAAEEAVKELSDQVEKLKTEIEAKNKALLPKNGILFSDIKISDAPHLKNSDQIIAYAPKMIAGVSNLEDALASFRDDITIQDRAESVLALLGTLKNYILPSIGTLSLMFGFTNESLNLAFVQIDGWVGFAIGIVTIFLAYVMEYNKTVTNKKKLEQKLDK